MRDAGVEYALKAEITHCPDIWLSQFSKDVVSPHHLRKMNKTMIVTRAMLPSWDVRIRVAENQVMKVVFVIRQRLRGPLCFVFLVRLAHFAFSAKTSSLLFGAGAAIRPKYLFSSGH